MGSEPMTGVLIREVMRTLTHTEGRPREDMGETAVHMLRRGPPNAPTLQTLILGLWLPELGENAFLLFKTPSLW